MRFAGDMWQFRDNGLRMGLPLMHEALRCAYTGYTRYT